MKNNSRLLRKSVVLITLSLLCMNNVWFFTPEFGNGFLLVISFNYILDYFGLCQKEDGKWVWKTKRKV